MISREGAEARRREATERERFHHPFVIPPRQRNFSPHRLFPLPFLRAFAPSRLRVKNGGAWLLTALTLLALALPRAGAHEDPVGDVYPRVNVRNGQFVVTFFCNKAMTMDFPKKNIAVYETTIGADGTLVAERKQVAMVSCSDYYSEPDDKETWNFYTRPQPFVWKPARQHPVFPEERIIWPGHFTYDLSRAATSYRSKLFCHLSSGMEMTSHEKVPLYLAEIDPLTGLARTAKLGYPSRIYQFAAASNVCVVEGQAYLAWMWEGVLRHLSLSREELSAQKLLVGTWQSDRDEDRYYRYVTRLVLSRWNPETGGIEHFFLPDRIGWNTSLSLDAIGDKLLIAWHVGIPSATPNAKIMTRFVDTSKLRPHVSQLTPSLDFEPQFSL